MCKIILSTSKKIKCIVCPTGCEITGYLDDKGEMQISGHGCVRGKQYAMQELICPARVFTGVMRAQGSGTPVPVRSSRPLPKDIIPFCALLVRHSLAKLPVRTGDVILSNVLKTGVDIVATYDLKSES